MGWNLAIVHAAGPAATVDGFALATGYRPDAESEAPSFEEHLFSGRDDDPARPVLAITEIGAGLLIAAPLILNHDWAALLSARGGEATWAVWQSVTTTYGFAHYRDGAKVRELQRSELQTRFQDGAPLPVEHTLRWADPAREPDDEEDLFALVGRVTGLPDAAVWLDRPARTYRAVALTELEPPKKKRRFLR